MAGCGTVIAMAGESRPEKGSAEGSEPIREGVRSAYVRTRATTDAREGGRAEDGAGQGNPPASDLGSGGGTVTGQRLRRSPRARSASSSSADSTRLRAAARALIADWPPLTGEQRERLALLLRVDH